MPAFFNNLAAPSPSFAPSDPSVYSQKVAAAIDNYRKALAITPKHTGAYSGLAHQLKTIGRQQEAVEVNRENIAANPKNTDPYWNLANLKTFRFEDNEVAAMETLLEDDNLSKLGVAQLCNSLGLEYEGRKDYDRAFSYFHPARRPTGRAGSRSAGRP